MSDLDARQTENFRLALDPTTPDYMLSHLACNIRQIRMAVVNNPNTSKATLGYLTNDADQTIADIARRRFDAMA